VISTFCWRNSHDNLLVYREVFLYRDNLDAYRRFFLSDLSSDSVEGYLFIVDKNAIPVDDLRFLKGAIVNLYRHGKKVALIGLPYCFRQYLFGTVDFIAIDQILQDVALPLFERYGAVVYDNSAQISGCRHCIVAGSCEGLGMSREELRIPVLRIKPEKRAECFRRIRFTHKDIDAQYRSFIHHLEKFPLYYTDRTLSFSSVLRFSSKSSYHLDYSDRFIYYCRSLFSGELAEEREFLLQNTHNRNFAANLFDVFWKKHALIGFAYSVAAYRGSLIRESFYLYFADEAHCKHFLLAEGLGELSIRQEEGLSPEFIGTDFSFDKHTGLIRLDGVKIYYSATYEALLSELELPDSELKSFLKNILGASGALLIVDRFEADDELNLKKIGIKIEFTPLAWEDREKVLRFIDYDCADEVRVVTYFAFEFDLHLNLIKATVYKHCNTYIE